MLADLYAALGIGRDATPADIKRAHREGVRRTHPDAGGTADEFQKVQRAYLVLSNPKARAKYDETGQVEDDKPQADPDAGPLGVISHVMQAIISDEQADFTADLGVIISMALQKEIEKIEAVLRKHEAPLNRARKLKGRFKKRAGTENKIDGVIDWHISQIEMKIARGREAIAQCRRAQEIIAGYDFERDPIPQFFTTSTSASMFY